MGNVNFPSSSLSRDEKRRLCRADGAYVNSAKTQFCSLKKRILRARMSIIEGTCVTDAHFKCNKDGINSQALDIPHIALVCCTAYLK